MEETMIKTKTLLRTITVVAAGFIACWAQTAQGSTVQVGGCKTGLTNFTTIQAAVNAVPPGSTIFVCPGTYPEQVTIAGPGLDNTTLIGVAVTSMGVTTDAAVIVPPSGGLAANGTIFDSDGTPGRAALPQVLVLNASNVTISHITVDGESNQSCGAGLLVGIYYQDSSGTVTSSVARNQNEGGGNGDQCGFGILTESDGGGVGSNPTLTVSSSSVHNFQKNGIVARGNASSGNPGTGPVLSATGNTVIGVGPVPGNAAQNGIEIAFGATGSVKGNYVADVLYSNNSSSGTGILFYATSGAPVASSNTVDSANIGIGVNYDPGFGGGGNVAAINGNHIGGSQMDEGIDLCGNAETAESNVIYSSTVAGVFLDNTCGGSSGSNDTVKSNTINEACAGILLGSGNGNSIGSNTYANDTYEMLLGDSCPPAAASVKANLAGSSTGQHAKSRP
jgi:hypothetical protein